MTMFGFYVQVIAHNGKGRGSRIIIVMTRGRFSHLSLRFVNTPDLLILWLNTIKIKGVRILWTKDHELESIQGKGVQHQPFVPSDNQTTFNFHHTPEQAEIILRTAVGLLGKKYDWSGIGGFITRRDKENPNRWFCSELVAYCLLKAGIVLLNMKCYKQSPRITCASTLLIEEERS